MYFLRKLRDEIRLWGRSNFTYLIDLFRYKNPAKPNADLVIELSQIKFVINDRRLSRLNKAYKKIYRSVSGVVEGTFWDHIESVDEHSDKLVGFRQRFLEGVDWEDTVLFDGYRQQLEKTGKAQGHRNIKELVDYYKSNHDSLYRSLVTEGFKTGKWKEGISAIYVYIYKDGSFVSNSGGNHRLNMARVAGIKQVPVRIKGRHKDWQLLRDELFVLGTDKFLEKYPDLINHPDLFG